MLLAIAFIKYAFYQALMTGCSVLCSHRNTLWSYCISWSFPFQFLDTAIESLSNVNFKNQINRKYLFKQMIRQSCRPKDCGLFEHSKKVGIVFETAPILILGGQVDPGFLGKTSMFQSSM